MDAFWAIVAAIVVALAIYRAYYAGRRRGRSERSTRGAEERGAAGARSRLRTQRPTTTRPASQRIGDRLASSGQNHGTDLKELISALDGECLRATEAAVADSLDCLALEVEPERVILALLSDEGSAFLRAIRRCKIDEASFVATLDTALDSAPRRRPEQPKPTFSPRFVRWIHAAKMIADQQDRKTVSSDLLLLVLAHDPDTVLGEAVATHIAGVDPNSVVTKLQLVR